jgi:hypothetical protein
MNLSISRETAALDDAASVKSLLSVLPVPHLVRAHLARVREGVEHACQYDRRAETLHYVASDGEKMVRLSVAGLPMQRAASAILATSDVIHASAKAVGVKLAKMLVLPAHVHPRAEAAPPSPHPEVRESLRIVPLARVPTF